tara:strand:+ start:4256 stop:4867 length:612 start_codon:yes stop_codon:yes gene_type:complete
MIVLDIETTGIDFSRCGIWQVGAIDLETKEEFLEEARIDEDEEILNAPEAKKTVYEVTGLTDEDFRDPKKQSQKELLVNLFRWLEKRKIKNLICHNSQFDIGFLWTKARKYGLKIPFDHHAFDLHSIAQLKYLQVKDKFLIKGDHSGMGLLNISDFCGMQDNRKEHNALEDVKLTAECFSRIIEGKNIFSEYKQFPIPEYLKK